MYYSKETMATPGGAGVVLVSTGGVSYTSPHPDRGRGVGHLGQHRRVQIAHQPSIYTCACLQSAEGDLSGKVRMEANEGIVPPEIGEEEGDSKDMTRPCTTTTTTATAALETSLVNAIKQAVRAGNTTAITALIMPANATVQHRHTIIQQLISQSLYECNLDFLSNLIDLSASDDVDHAGGKIAFHDVFRLCREWSEVERLIRFAARHKGALLRLRDPCGRTALQVALLHGDVGLCVDIMAAEPELVHIRNTGGQTALHTAVVSGCTGVECVGALLAAGADVKGRITGGNRRTPVIEAAMVGNLAVLQVLLQHGADMNTPDRAGFSPLHHAVSGGHIHCTQALLDAGALLDNNIVNTLAVSDVGNEPDTRDDANCDKPSPPLIVAVKGGFADVTRLLVERGCAISQKDSMSGWSALHYAVTESPEPSCLSVLLTAATTATEVNALSDDGRTALMLAVSFGQCDMVSCLLKHPHCDVNAADTRSQMTALHRAADAGCHLCTSLLLSAGAIPNAVDRDGTTPLLLAVNSRHTHLIAELLLWGPGRWPWEPLVDNEQTVLNIVVKRCYWDIAQYLLTAGWSIGDFHKHIRCKGGTLGSLPQTLEERLCSPPTLKHMCRLRFKAKLRLNAPKVINSLGFPAAIKSYLLFSDLSRTILHQIEQ